MLALLLLILQLLLLAYFLFFAFYLIRYGLACFKKPYIKKVDKISNDKVAIIIVSFNEKDILKDTHAACEKLNYKNKVIIYADDSNDNYTFPMLKKFAQQKGAKQIFDHRFDNKGKTIVYESSDFVLFHRTYNIGFKAGSLKEIEKYLKARNFKYMYLLDADWEPQPDSIERCMEVIEADKKIAYVQTKRISYYGKGENLQRCLALNEDGNYFVDLPGRQAVGDIILFSGCCTLFRLEYLYKAKGFKPGHITEDMDLTNRYYLLGYKGIYLEDVENIGDVPFHYTAYRRQQDRWARGTARCLREYFWPIIKSKKMNFREKMSLIRQNAYFTTAIGIETSIILAFLNVVLLSWYADNYSAVLYEYFVKFIAWPYTILLIVALLSNFIPLLITCYKRRKFSNILFIPFATWISWSNLHNYFISNIKGFISVKAIWDPTPKLSQKKRVIIHKEKVKMPSNIKFRFANLITLFVICFIYWLELTYLGRIDIYAFFWIPALTIGTVYS